MKVIKLKESSFIIKEASKGQRLDKYLAKENDISRSYVQKLLNERKITVNGKSKKGSYKIKTGDNISLLISSVKTPEIELVEMELDILHEDDYIIVINKPPGLIVHPVPGNCKNTLVNGLLAYTENLSDISGKKRPGILHRLDKDTSGALVVAKNNLSHRELVKQFKNREILKIYHTIVKGNIPHDRGIIDAPIGRDPYERKRMAVRKDHSKKAVSHFEVIRRFNGFTYLKVRLKTGRTHQIRVHCSYLGHPILGDNKYTKQKKKNRLSVKRQLLHAYILGFKHPVIGKWMEFTAPLPEDFLQVLDFLRKSI